MNEKNKVKQSSWMKGKKHKRSLTPVSFWYAVAKAIVTVFERINSFKIYYVLILNGIKFTVKTFKVQKISNTDLHNVSFNHFNRFQCYISDF